MKEESEYSSKFIIPPIEVETWPYLSKLVFLAFSFTSLDIDEAL